MEFLARALAYLLLGLGVLTLAVDIVRSIGEGAPAVTSLGELWFNLSPGSLNLVQTVIQRYIWPVLWDPVIVAILHWPAWAVLGVPGLLLLYYARRKARRRKMIFAKRR